MCRCGVRPVGRLLDVLDGASKRTVDTIVPIVIGFAVIVILVFDRAVAAPSLAGVSG